MGMCGHNGSSLVAPQFEFSDQGRHILMENLMAQLSLLEKVRKP